MQDNDNKNNTGIQITISPEVADGIYSNLSVIVHSSSEFIIDFASFMPQQPVAKVHSRVIMTPENAKRLLLALNDNVRKFESAYGNIDINNNNNSFIPPISGGGDA